MHQNQDPANCGVAFGFPLEPPKTGVPHQTHIHPDQLQTEVQSLLARVWGGILRVIIIWGPLRWLQLPKRFHFEKHLFVLWMRASSQCAAVPIVLWTKSLILCAQLEVGLLARAVRFNQGVLQYG